MSLTKNPFQAAPKLLYRWLELQNLSVFSLATDTVATLDTTGCSGSWWWLIQYPVSQIDVSQVLWSFPSMPYSTE